MHSASPPTAPDSHGYLLLYYIHTSRVLSPFRVCNFVAIAEDPLPPFWGGTPYYLLRLLPLCYFCIISLYGMLLFSFSCRLGRMIVPSYVATAKKRFWRYCKIKNHPQHTPHTTGAPVYAGPLCIRKTAGYFPVFYPFWPRYLSHLPLSHLGTAPDPTPKPKPNHRHWAGGYRGALTRLRRVFGWHSL